MRHVRGGDGAAPITDRGKGPGGTAGQEAVDRKALLERLRAETFRAGLPTAAIDAELRELQPPPAPATAPSALEALQAAKAELDSATQRQTAALTKVAHLKERLKRLQEDLQCVW